MRRGLSAPGVPQSRHLPLPPPPAAHALGQPGQSPGHQLPSSSSASSTAGHHRVHVSPRARNVLSPLHPTARMATLRPENRPALLASRLPAPAPAAPGAQRCTSYCLPSVYRQLLFSSSISFTKREASSHLPSPLLKPQFPSPAVCQEL